MSGHASIEEQREIESREARLDRASSPANEVLELALMYLEPAHREDEAIELLESIVAREPQHAEARLWLAYALLHFLMDRPALARANEVLATLRNDPVYAGAANMLLAEIGEEQHAELGERIRFLEASVAAEPTWINNRHDLAMAYAEAGRVEEATAQLRVALENVRSEEAGWTRARRQYEESFTGRTAFAAAERMRAALRDLG